MKELGSPPAGNVWYDGTCTVRSEERNETIHLYMRVKAHTFFQARALLATAWGLDPMSITQVVVSENQEDGANPMNSFIEHQKDG